MPNKMRSNAVTSQVTTRSIVVEGALTTISMEEAFWRDLEAIAKENDLTVAEVVSLVEDSLGNKANLSSALRAYIAVSRVRH